MIDPLEGRCMEQDNPDVTAFYDIPESYEVIRSWITPEEYLYGAFRYRLYDNYGNPTKHLRYLGITSMRLLTAGTPSDRGYVISYTNHSITRMKLEEWGDDTKLEVKFVDQLQAFYFHDRGNALKAHNLILAAI
jgi:hypothetical protein